MRTVLTLCALLLAAPAFADPRPVVIKMDLGGWIPTYEQRAYRWAAEGRKVIIDGDCRSACTYYLWSKYHLNICVTPNARLMFHMPFWRTGQGRYDIEATPARVEWSQKRWQAMLAEYPAAIAAKVRNSPNPSKIKDARVYKTLTGSALDGLVKRCPTAG